jgi:hypothetical protein
MKAALFAVTLLATSSLALADASLKSQMKAMNKKIEATFLKKDIAGFAKVTKNGMTPDFKYSDEGGKPMGADMMIAGMKQGFSMYSKITTAKTTIVSVKEMGDSGRAVEKHMMGGITMGPDKKSHKMAYEGTSTETFKKVHGKWLMATMVMKTDKMTLDGKPAPMGGPGK